MRNYVIALYIRLSVEDFKTESLSIPNQKLILREKAMSLPEWDNSEILEFIDNHLQFVCANALEYPLPESDVFILNDVLHYMSYEHQRTLLLRCVEQLRPGGKLIVRDGNAANTGKHRLTRFTELLSTGIFNFNKTTEQLCFTSEEQIRSIAQACGMQLEILPNDRYTSNTIYIFQKNEPEHE